MVLQHAQSSFRTPWHGLDPTRIVATTGALALNIVILLLLLVPATRLVEQVPDITITVQPDRKKELPPPLPPVPTAKIEKPQDKIIPVPTVQKQVPVDVPSVDTSVVIPEGTLPATAETEAVPTASATLDPPAGPVVGVTLDYLHAPPPHYTRELLVARLEGTVYLQVLVDVDGKPLEVSIHKSSGERRLDEAARRFVLKNWTFRPAMQDGHAVQAIGIVPIDYRLD